MVRASARVETRILHTEESSTVQLGYTTAEEASGAFDPQNVCFRSIAFLCTRAPALLQAPPTTWLVYQVRRLALRRPCVLYVGVYDSYLV